jgi:hypothetical protein
MACYRRSVVRKHTRFELLEVKLDDAPLGRVTIDAWEDDAGQSQWTGRVLMKTGHDTTTGMLSGSMRDGTRLQGRVRLGDQTQGPGGRQSILVELWGEGPLAPAPADPTEPTESTEPAEP